MKTYVHNPALFRNHFAGNGLPAFRGTRIQRGYGSLKSKLKCYAVPIAQTTIKAATPHVKKIIRKSVSMAAQRAFPNSQPMQRMTNRMIKNVINNTGKQTSNGLLGVIQHTTQKKRKSSKSANRPAKVRKTARQNIFA